jgi:hypothetical protein
MEYQEYKKQMDKESDKQISDKYKAKVKQVSDKVDKGTKVVSKVIKSIPKNVSYRKELSSNLMKSFTGGSNKSSAPVGRPRGSLKWRSPFTGKPVPATEYYKEVRQFKKIQIQRAEQNAQRRMQEMARQGIPQNPVQSQAQPVQVPNQVTQMQRPVQVRPVQMRQIRPVQMRGQMQRPNRPMPNQMQVPNQGQRVVVNRSTPVWKYRRGDLAQEKNAFGRIKIVERGSPQGFWN